MPADEPCSRGQQPTAQQLPEVLSRRPRRLGVVVPVWRLVQAKGFCSCTLCRYLPQNCESSVKNGPECGRRSGPSTRRGQGFSPGGLATDRLNVPPFVPNAGPLNIGDPESTAPARPCLDHWWGRVCDPSPNCGGWGWFPRRNAKRPRTLAE
jgi:hypothetical protein